ncbi:MAG: CASTOR/POLLUX-related putative ion channel [Egibacteraceae bacterium]
MARGPLALIGWLGLLALAIVLIAAAVGHLLLGGVGGGVGEDFWKSVVLVLDSSAFGGEAAWPARLVALVVTLLGLFIGGCLIGLIATALEQRIQDLRKGRSAVLETGHTLILGWSARLPVIVQELVVANESLARSSVVMLAPRDVGDMDEELRDRVGDTKSTRIVCRSGNPAHPADLRLANIAAARSVIVLAGDGGDAEVVKTILGVKTLDPDFSRANVIAELIHPEHAQTLRVITDGAVGTVNSDDVIAQVTAQACHQSGLSVVFRDLLDFRGDECYFAEAPELIGRTYAEALLAFDASSVIGRATAGGDVQLNPPPDAVFAPGDRVIVVSEDDDTVAFTGLRDVDAPEPASPGSGAQAPIRVLIVGWSGFGPKVVAELDEFLAPGSVIEVCVDAALADPSTLDGIEPVNARLRVSTTSGGPEQPLSLGEVEPFDQVIVLGYREGMTIDEADSRTLLSLLTLRKVWPRQVQIIAQLLDQANVELAATTGVDDFIVSDALASLMLAQLSERAELQAVFDDLFDPDGAVVELRAAHSFVPDHPVRYEQIVAAGAAQAVSMLG